MRNKLAQLLALTTVATVTINAFTLAQQATQPAQPPTPPEAPTPPQPLTERDMIVVRPDVPGMFVYGDRVASRGIDLKQKLVKTAFLGVGVSAAPSVLSEQLKLPQGVGLVVEFVEKDSPAEKAGLQAKDVIHKLDDQLLINPQQLATLVRTFKPNDGVRLTVIRKGDVVTLNATLVEKEMPELSANTTQALEFYNAAPMPAMPNGPQMAAEIRALTEKRLAERGINGRVIRVKPGATTKIIKVDNDLRIELETREGQKNLRLQDKDGKSIFEGPYNTPEDMEKVPAEYRDRVKAVEEGIELKEVPATSPTEPKAEAKEFLTAGPKA